MFAKVATLAVVAASGIISINVDQPGFKTGFVWPERNLIALSSLETNRDALEKAVREMVEAERNFYRAGQERGTRAAFLQFLGADSVVFRPSPANGQKVWSERAETGLDLIWEPTLAVMAKSANFGFTTGPAHWKGKKTDEKPLGYGQFVSVWKKQADGSWKVALDVGTENPQPTKPPEPLRTIVAGAAIVDLATADARLVEAEKKLADLAKVDSATALISAAADSIRIYRDGIYPAVGKDAALSVLDSTRGNMSIEKADGEMSSSGDLAYAYGKYSLTRGQERAEGYYVHIWQTDAAGAWKLVADVEKQLPPPDEKQKTAELFAPQVISTDLDDSCGSFSPDGQSFYFVRRGAYTTTPPISIICFSEFHGGNWSHPEVVPFSGTYLDSSPCVSPDGKRLFFSSRRPTKANPNGRDWNIWFVDKIDPPSPNASPARTSVAAGNRWSEPQEIGEPINTPKNDTNPAVAADGTIYFASDRDSQPGYYHIYRARLTNGKYEPLEKLGPEINSGDADINPYVSPDQKFLIFASYRKDNLDSGGNHYDRADLYVSENRGGQWTPARHLEHGINTSASEGNPTVSGNWFYFTSERSPFEVPMKQQLTTASWHDRRTTIENGVGNIYRIPIEALELEQR